VTCHSITWVALYPDFLPKHSGKYLSSSSLFLWIVNWKANFKCIFCCISYSCSISGNPLICPTGSEPECYGTTLMPISMNLNNTPSKENGMCYPNLIIRFTIYNLLWIDNDSNLITSLAAQPADRPKSHQIALAFGSSVGSVSLIILVFGLFLWWRQRNNQPTFFDVKGV